MIFLINKKHFIHTILPIAILIILSLTFFFSPTASQIFTPNKEINEIINGIFTNRNMAILNEDLELLDALYDKDSKYGLWAYEHEVKKMKYLHLWSEKQGIKFINISPDIVIRKVNTYKDIYDINLLCSTTYQYYYLDTPDEINEFRIGTYHSIKLKKNDNYSLIVKEWYTDPFADSLNLENIKYEEIKKYISSQNKKDISNLNKRRSSAVEYSDKYCGSAGSEKYGYKYNKKYRNYNSLGGDCANFASQTLYEGSNFKKNSAWNYDKKGGTKAWLNANAFKNYMLNSGRASVVAHGTYEKVYKVSYKLQPGDIVAYEKKGKVTHISTVTGADSKGYSLVNCHNTDRYRVPWDLGWSNKGIKFWLIHVNY